MTNASTPSPQRPGRAARVLVLVAPLVVLGALAACTRGTNDGMPMVDTPTGTTVAVQAPTAASPAPAAGTVDTSPATVTYRHP